MGATTLKGDLAPIGATTLKGDLAPRVSLPSCDLSYKGALKLKVDLAPKVPSPPRVTLHQGYALISKLNTEGKALFVFKLRATRQVVEYSDKKKYYLLFWGNKCILTLQNIIISNYCYSKTFYIHILTHFILKLY